MDSLQIQHIREVLSYSQKFQDNTFVFYIDDLLIQEPYLSRLVKDILYLLDIGIKLIMVAGARNAISTILAKYNFATVFKNNVRIIHKEAMDLVQMASFDSTVRLINAFSIHNQTMTLGNWINARGLGVIEGIDYLHAGVVETVAKEDINKLLNDKIIPVFPAIGWSAAGKPYSLEAITLTAKIGVELQANKLFYLLANSPSTIMASLEIHANEHIDNNNNGNLRRIQREGAMQILLDNTTRKHEVAHTLLEQAVYALSNRVDRVHLLNGEEDGGLLEELFTSWGTGLMVHNDEYQAIVPLLESELDFVLRLMQPLIEKGILLERSIQQLRDSYKDYVAYKADGDIYGVAALHKLDSKTAEIAGVLVNEHFHNRGVGKKLVQFLLMQAKRQGYTRALALTKATGDWFEKMQFVQTDISEVPESRKAHYLAQNRKSRIYKYSL